MWLYILVSCLVVVIFLIAFFAFRYIFGRAASTDLSDKGQLLSSAWFMYEKQISAGIRWIQKQKWQDTEIRSSDGLKLCGRWLKKAGAKKTALLFHGYHSMGQNDFSLSVRRYYEQGFNILMPDQRAHGNSEGKYCTFGALESGDCRLWIDEALSLFGSDTEILLAGVSMGASTVMMALKGGLPGNVKCVVADSGFTSPKDIIKWYMKNKYHMYLFPLLQIVCLYCRVFARFVPSAYDTREILAENADIPVFLAHGKPDAVVPYSMSEENNKACRSEHYFFSSETAMHAGSALTDQTEYFKALDTFTARFFS